MAHGGLVRGAHLWRQGDDLRRLPRTDSAATEAASRCRPF